MKEGDVVAGGKKHTLRPLVGLLLVPAPDRPKATLRNRRRFIAASDSQF